MIVKNFEPYEPSILVAEDKKITDMAEKFMEHPPKHHLCVVDENGKLLGIINRKRIFQNIFSHHVSVESRVTKLYNLLTAEKAKELMFTDVITVTESENIDIVIKKMIENDLFEIPVVDSDNRILGLLTSEQILKKMIKKMT